MALFIIIFNFLMYYISVYESYCVFPFCRVFHKFIFKITRISIFHVSYIPNKFVLKHFHFLYDFKLQYFVGYLSLSNDITVLELIGNYQEIILNVLIIDYGNLVIAKTLE